MESDDRPTSSANDEGTNQQETLTNDVLGIPSLLDPDFSIEAVRRFLASTLGLHPTIPKTPLPKVLDNFTVDSIVKYIKDNKCHRIVTMAGAGISTSAGIPDFRSPGSGLYDNLEKYNLPHPQAIFELSFLRENPKPFFALAKELCPGRFRPTIGHYFIKLLQEKEMLLRHYTQNIDTLERVAGIVPEKLVEAHGSFYKSHCIDCKSEFSFSWVKEKIFSDEVPRCEHCNGIVKPDIVFFGESLPMHFFECSEIDFPVCDLLIIMGSSLMVQPFASLKDRVRDDCPRLLVNREKVGQTDNLFKQLGIPYGFDFDPNTATRDVFWQGSCDEGCQLLADKLGWGQELMDMVRREHEILDKSEGEHFQNMNVEHTLCDNTT